MQATKYVDKIILLDEILDENKFIVPQFQRSVVWKPRKRKEFLRSVREGEPFGIILIQEQDGQYKLIDGLQRISTIKDYLKNPFDYLEPSDIDMELVDELIRVHLNTQGLPVDENYVQKAHEDWRDRIYNCLKGGLKNYQVMSNLRGTYGLKLDEDIDNAIDEICSKFEESRKLDGLKIMAINYIGPEENIPNVFYNLNTGGVQLSKYETYAALWFKPVFKVDDAELIEVVRKKYRQLQNDSDLDVDYSEASLDEEGITLFEYCYALSGVMRSEEQGFDILFSANNKSTDPTGFELLALLLTDRVNKADLLHKILKDAPPQFLVDLKNTIKGALNQIEKALSPILVGMNHSSLCSDSTYLIYHMIVSYLKEYYIIDTKNYVIQDRASTLNKNDFKRFASLHYLYDCLTDYWKLNRQVGDLQREVSDEKSRQKYWHRITENDWQEAIQDFMDSQRGSGKTITQKNKLFVDFITQMRVKENPLYTQYFTETGLAGGKYELDFEHIVPKKIIESHIIDLPDSRQKTYYVSAVGNLCYLTAKDNRSKRDKTLYEFAEDRPAYVTDQNYRDCIMYPDKSELLFTKFGNDDFRKAYDQFLDNRHNQLQKEFLRLIKNY